MRDSAQVRSTLSSAVMRETTKDMLEVFITSLAVLHLVDAIVKQYSHRALKCSIIWHTVENQIDHDVQEVAATAELSPQQLVQL